MKLLHLIIILFVGIITSAQSQTIKHFSFKIDNREQLDTITKYISIDDFDGTTVIAYANSKEWDKFLSWGLSYKDIVSDNSSKVLNMASTITEMANWDRYPTYEVYVQMMEKFATDYPNICKLEEIGTLSSGRKLLAVKISDNVNSDNEVEPELFYTGTMHGDETTGFVLLLRLIDYILSNYGNATYTSVNNLVNGAEIWINPAANPDGTYYGGNSSLSSARRYNGSSIDINRNFPDPDNGEHPDGNSWQEETIAMMNFAESHHFSLSANFHGGAEVVNYPWDTWSRLVPDDAWWKYVSREYATLAQENSPAGYLTDLTNGITNGYAWYSVAGGRQDYMNYYQHCREVTMEISSVKLLSTDKLDDYWDYNRDALMAYLTQGLYGVKGTVKDASGNPLEAKITVNNHDTDADNSWVTTDIRAGDYIRYLKEGTYSFTFSADGLADRTINNIVVSDDASTILNVVMGAPQSEISISRNEIESEVVLDETLIEELELSNIGTADLNYNIAIEDAANYPWVSLNNTSNSIEPSNSQIINVVIDATGLNEQIYSCNIKITGDTSITIPINITVYTRPLLEVNKEVFNAALLIIDESTDSLIISNPGNANLNYTITVKDADDNPWISLSENSGIVIPDGDSKVYVSFNPAFVGVGFYSTKILIEGDIIKVIPVSLKVDTVPVFKDIDDQFQFEMLIGETQTKTISLKNIGGEVLAYQSDIDFQEGSNWLAIEPSEGNIEAAQTEIVDFYVNCSGLAKGEYSALVFFKSEYDTLEIPVYLKVDTLPELWKSKVSVSLDAFIGETIKDTIEFKNIGGGKIDISANTNYENGSGWLIPVNSEFQLGANESAKFVYTMDARNLEYGNYKAKLSFGTDFNDSVNISFNVHNNPELSLDIFTINQIVDYQKSTVDTVLLKNSGGGILNYNISFDLDSPNGWVVANKTSGEIVGGEKDTIILSFNSTDIEAGVYSGKLIITTKEEKRIPITFEVKSPAQLYLSESEISFELPPYEQFQKSVKISNYGESILNYEVNYDGEAPKWLTLDNTGSGELKAQESTDILITAKAVEVSGTYKSNVFITSNGGDSFFGVTLNIFVGVNDENVPSESEVYPNPFSQSVTFNFSDININTELNIYNAIGVKVVELQPHENNIEGLKFIWNGKGQNSEILPKGIYIFRIFDGVNYISGKVQKL